MSKKKTTEPKKITWEDKNIDSFHDRYSRLEMLKELEAHLDKLPHVPFYETKHGESPREIAQRLIDEERKRIDGDYQQHDADIKAERVEYFAEDKRLKTELFLVVKEFFQRANEDLPNMFTFQRLSDYLQSVRFKEALTGLAVHIYSGRRYGFGLSEDIHREWVTDTKKMSISELQEKYHPKMVDALRLLCDPSKYVKNLAEKKPFKVASDYLRDFLKVTEIGRARGAPPKTKTRLTPQ